MAIRSRAAGAPRSRPGHERTAPVDLLDTYTPPHASDPEPVRQLRRELRSLQGARVPFPVAWPLAHALVGPDLHPWREALAFAHDEWRAAYLGEPPMLSFGVPDPWHAVAQLADVVSDLLELVA